MWKCEICGSEFDDETTAIEVKFGYVDSERVIDGDQYMAFCPDCGYAPLCDECAIAYIKGKKG